VFYRRTGERLARARQNLPWPRTRTGRTGQGPGDGRRGTPRRDNRRRRRRCRRRRRSGRRRRNYGRGGARGFRPGGSVSHHRRVDRPSRQWRANRGGRARRRPALFRYRRGSRSGGRRRFFCGCRHRMRLRRRRRRIRGGRGRFVMIFRGAVRLRFGLQIRRIESVQPAQLDGDVLVDRAGVRLLLGYAQFGEPIENLVSLNFQLTRQLIDANLSHRKSNQFLPSRRSFPATGRNSGLFAAVFRNALFRSGRFRGRSF
jgi:hypothetical protein